MVFWMGECGEDLGEFYGGDGAGAGEEEVRDAGAAVVGGAEGRRGGEVGGGFDVYGGFHGEAVRAREFGAVEMVSCDTKRGFIAIRDATVLQVVRRKQVDSIAEKLDSSIGGDIIAVQCYSM